jgi:hypothetical protein
VTAKPPIAEGVGGVNTRRSASSSRPVHEGSHGPRRGLDIKSIMELDAADWLTFIVPHIGVSVNGPSKKAPW